VENLDAARLRAATLVRGRFDPAAAEPLYEKTFAKAGMGSPGDEVEAVAARMRDSDVCAEIVAVLDDWAGITQDRGRLEWLLAVARAADPDPSRDHLRRPELWRDGRELKKLVQKQKGEELSPQLARAAARALVTTGGGDEVSLLSAAQERFPNDFWLNFELGWALHVAGRNDQAIGFFRAALALRPEAPPHLGLGMSLLYGGRHDEAIRHYEQALAKAPNFAMAHNNLGSALEGIGRLDQAAYHYQEAIRHDPETSATAHCNLGRALWKLGRLEEAVPHLQEAIRGGPKVSAAGHANLGYVLSTWGRLDEAIEHYRESIRLEPNEGAMTYYWLGDALWSKRRPEEAIGHLQQAVRLDPLYHRAWQALGLTCYEAARGAVADAVGEGPGRGRLGESERAARRRQALDWLRASLKARTKLIDEGQRLRWSITTWQSDPALASVRNASELARLPDAERAQWQLLWADVSELSAARPTFEARALATCGDWPKAADCYRQALKLRPTDNGHFWFECAAVSLLSGDHPGYARARAFLMDNGGKKDGPRAYHAARTCTLAGGAVAETALSARLAEKELEEHAREFWSLTERGALAYRAGHYQEAVPFFEKSLDADSRPGSAVVNWLWLALAHQRLGRSEDARRWLDKATAWLDQLREGMMDRAKEDQGLHLHNWLEAHVLRREAEALIAPKGP
jgi:tetratricopeptide (TPR) repeat protein